MECGYTQRIKIQGETFHLYPVAIEVEDFGGFKPGRVPTLKNMSCINFGVQLNYEFVGDC